MKNTKPITKRLLAFVLVLAMCAGMLGTSALADSEGEPVCGLEEHTHGDECYKTETTLVCEQEESEGHTHTDDCYTTESALTCGLEESEGHAHTDACYAVSEEPVCGLEETEGHTHTDACYTKELTCEIEESEGHTHGDDCYTETSALTCGLEESQGHTHTEDCYTETKNLTCEKAEHTHTDACYAQPAADPTPNDGPEIIDNELPQEGAAKIGGQTYSTLSAALNAVEENGTVTLLKNVTEAVSLPTKSFTLDLGGKTITAPTGNKQNGVLYTSSPLGSNEAVTIKNGTINGNGTSRGLCINNRGTSTVTLEGLTVTDCAGSQSAAQLEASVLTLTNCTFTDNTFSAYAVYISGENGGARGKATVTGCHFTKNTGTGSPVYTMIVTDFTGCEFANNQGTETGALKVYHSKYDQSTSLSVQITGCTFDSNSATSDGIDSAGAIFMQNATVTIDGSTITGNKAVGGNGAIRFKKEGSTGQLLIRTTKMSGNETESTDATASGGLNGNNSTYYETGALYNNKKGDDTPSDIYIENSIGRLLAASDMGLTGEKPYVWKSSSGKIYEKSVGSLGDIKNVGTTTLYATDDYTVEKPDKPVDPPKPAAKCQMVIVVGVDTGGELPAGYKDKEYTVKVTGPDGHETTIKTKTGALYYLNDLVPGEYTVTEEEESAKFDGYALTVSYSSTVVKGVVKVTASGIPTYVTIINKYAKQTCALGFRIKVAGIDTQELTGKTLSFNITGPGGFYFPLTLTIPSTYNVSLGGYSFLNSLTNLVPGTYAATFLSCNLEGYEVKVTSGSLEATARTDRQMYFTPVLTFSAANYIADNGGDAKYTSLQQALDAGGNVYIYDNVEITETLRVTKPVTLTSKNNTITLTRGNGLVDKEFIDAEGKDSMFVVEQGGALTLTNITLDGGSGSGLEPQCAIIKVKGGNLVLDNGATLCNNKLVYNKEHYKSIGGYSAGTVSSDRYNGGGVYVKSGAMEMNDGAIIENCQAENGGGVLIEGGTFTMNGGEIRDNSVSFTNAQIVKNDKTYYDFNVGCGGGVLIAGEGYMVFNGGTISGNHAGFGGGIADGEELGRKNMVVGEYDDQLVMNGGTITGNKADANGGGIFVGWGTSADIKAGYITNNECAIDPNSYTTGARSALYGGGGIYVQGDDKYTGVLKLACVEITGNNANLNGGGVAGCPYSEVTVHFDESGIIYGNNDGTVSGGTLSHPGEEIYITAHDWSGIAHPTVKFSPFMIGGGEYNWTDEQGNRATYDELDMQLNEGAVSLYNEHAANDSDVTRAAKYVQVHITGNISHAGGGGIGTNGTVEIGETTTWEKDIDLYVSKTWSDDGFEAQRPESVTFTLYQNDVAIDTYVMTPDAEGNWPSGAVLAFGNLPMYDLRDFDKDNSAYEPGTYTYRIEEQPVAGYESSDAKVTGNTWAFTNTYVPEPETTSLTVNKVWANLDGTATVPAGAAVIVTLVRDGAATDTTATLSAENGWTYTFADLEVGHEYTVVETAFEGYTAAYSENINGVITITNTQTPPPEPETTSLTVNKTWADYNGNAMAAPEGAVVTVTLVRDGAATDTTVTLSAENGWTYTFAGLEVGHVYTVVETAFEGYTAAYSENVNGVITITNTQTPPPEPETTSLTVNKVWADYNGNAMAAPEGASVTVRLYDGETELRSFELNAANGWTHTFADLAPDGDYHITEDAYTGFTTTVTVNPDGSVTVTNTQTPPPPPGVSYTSVSVRKVWNDAGFEAQRPESVEVQLYRDGAAYGAVVALSEANGWSYTWQLLDDEYDWTVGEVNAPAGYASTVTGNGADFVITNTYNIPEPELGALTVAKAVEGLDEAGRSYTFTVTGPEGYSTTVTVPANGSVTLTGLVPGVYTVTEDVNDAGVEGYMLVDVTGEGSVEVAANATANIQVTNVYEPETEIPDEPPPLTDLPDVPPPLTEIPDDDVPLDDLPETGDKSRFGAWLALMASSLTGAIALLLMGKKRRDEEDQ